jgi:hypothetical protein
MVTRTVSRGKYSTKFRSTCIVLFDKPTSHSRAAAVARGSVGFGVRSIARGREIEAGIAVDDKEP